MRYGNILRMQELIQKLHSLRIPKLAAHPVMRQPVLPEPEASKGNLSKKNLQRKHWKILKKTIDFFEKN